MKMTKSRIRWAVHTARMGEMRNADESSKPLMVKSVRKITLEYLTKDGRITMKRDIKELERKAVGWIHKEDYAL
jgi:hypothetical protein